MNNQFVIMPGAPLKTNRALRVLVVLCLIFHGTYQPGIGQFVLTWPSGILQSAPAIEGPYNDILGASSPYIVVPSNPQEYFRVRVPIGGP